VFATPPPPPRTLLEACRAAAGSRAGCVRAWRRSSSSTRACPSSPRRCTPAATWVRWLAAAASVRACLPRPCSAEAHCFELADPRVGGGAGPAAGRMLAAWERQPPVAPPATWRAPPPAGFADARGMRLAALEPWRPVRRAALRAARHDATASLLTGCRATLTAHVHVSLHCDVSWWIIWEDMCLAVACKC